MYIFHIYIARSFSRSRSVLSKETLSRGVTGYFARFTVLRGRQNGGGGGGGGDDGEEEVMAVMVMAGEVLLEAYD